VVCPAERQGKEHKPTCSTIACSIRQLHNLLPIIASCASVQSVDAKAGASLLALGFAG